MRYALASLTHYNIFPFSHFPIIQLSCTSATQAIVDDPALIWEGIKQPYVEAWESGRPGEAIGRGTLEVVSSLVGTKGLDKLQQFALLCGTVLIPLNPP
ncbi:MAG: hypothetical protein F6K47_38710 [Symploca sp. SIO2E6]|nr:hypothetical protein [Symploca sp. SIO2E6]